MSKRRVSDVSAVAHLFCRWSWVLVLVVALVGCKKNQTSPSSRRLAHAKSPQRTESTLQPPVAELTKNWLSQTWLEAVANDFQILVKLLRDSKPEEKADALALMLNRYQQVNDGAWLNPKTMTSLHRAMRIRLHLRLARFYKQAFELSLGLQLDLSRRRLRRKGKISVGKLFQYYRGRLLCLKGRFGEAGKAFARASQQVGAQHKLRVKLWQVVCQKDVVQRQKAVSALVVSSWSKEPAVWAEWLLLQSFFSLKTKVDLPATLAARASLFAQVWQNKAWRRKASVMRALVDVGIIKEGSVSTKQKFYDPGVLWIAARHHAQSAQRYLAGAAKSDAFAPFFRAQVWTLLGQPKKALSNFTDFIKAPPKSFVWGYVLFSSRMRLADFVAEAKARVALLHHQTGQTKEAVHELEALAKEGYPAKVWAGWGLVQVFQGKSKAKWAAGWSWMWAGAELARDLEKRLLKRYLVLAPKKKGAAAIVQYRLYRYATRDLYLLASQGALWIGASDKAVRWLEVLHHKEKPHLIGHENQPDQILWTVLAYHHAGRWGVCTQFMRKNKALFPSLVQHFEAYGFMRIFRGMGASQGPKGG